MHPRTAASFTALAIGFVAVRHDLARKAAAGPPPGAAMAVNPSHGLATIRAQHDSRLRIRRTSEQRLLYLAGADAADDRPAHVRAGSALGWLGDQLAVVQDDANFVALWDPSTGLVDHVTLPPGEDGRRTFDSARGNKMDKLDLEAAAIVPARPGGMLVAFGSGSSPAREVIVRVSREPGASPSTRQDAVPELYAALRANDGFAGSELNIEGAVILSDGTLRLFQRGNGAPREGLSPVNATIDFAWAELEAWLDRRDRPVPVPGAGAVVRYELGEVDGIRLSFTDAALGPRGGVLFLASAEDSPDAIRDGRVVASAVGVLDPSGGARYALVEDEEGRPLALKLEGMAPVPDRSDEILLVADPDDPGTPASLLRVRLTGPWWQ